MRIRLASVSSPTLKLGFNGGALGSITLYETVSNGDGTYLVHGYELSETRTVTSASYTGGMKRLAATPSAVPVIVMAMTSHLNRSSAVRDRCHGNPSSPACSVGGGKSVPGQRPLGGEAYACRTGKFESDGSTTGA